MFNGLNGNNDGRIAIGNDLPIGFTPTGRLHLHQTGGNNFLRFTNNFTGTGGGDGLFLGINNIGNGFLGNFEPDQDILFLTEAQERMRIWSTTENGMAIPYSASYSAVGSTMYVKP